MAKARKGLLLSLLTLLIAVAITATSTFAWFVVNKEVTASNMQIEVKSDTTYLVISETNTTGMLDTLTDTSKSLTAQNAKVLPVRYNAEGSGETKWEYTSGTAYDNGAKNSEANWSVVSAENVDKYTVKYTFYVGLTTTTALPAKNLIVKSLKATALDGEDAKFLPAVSVMVQCGETCLNFADVNTNSSVGSSAILSPTVAKGQVYQIDAYVYINGDNSVVKSSNAANLGKFTLTMKLGVTPGSDA